MDIDGLCLNMVVKYTFLLLICLQGTYSSSLDSEKNDDRQEIKLFDMIRGMYKPNDDDINMLDDKSDLYNKRGQGWAIMYGKRGHQRWSIAYGKRNTDDDVGMYDKEPLFRQTKRSYPMMSFQKYFKENPSQIKRQQGWHIAYGKRTFPSERF